MNEYIAMENRHQQEVNSFPLGFAFGNYDQKRIEEYLGELRRD